METIKIAIRQMAQFVYMSGDLSNEMFYDSEGNEGQKAHHFWQSKYSEKDKKEYFIKHQITKDDIEIIINGFIDGVLVENDEIIIEEIKSTTIQVKTLDIHYKKAHLLQCQIYAYLYGLINKLDHVKIKLTYINIDTYETISFYETYKLVDLEKEFSICLEEYLAWYFVLLDNQEKKVSSIQGLNFPFTKYRKNQREFMKYCYETILKKEILYAIAPTGIGKTMATLYSSLKTIKENNEKIFYLTAKNLGKTAAIDAIIKLENFGLEAHTVEITAKDKICFLEERNCDPTLCPYAKEFYTKLRNATVDIYTNETLITQGKVSDYAKKHMVCPFEYSLYLTYFADIIICDYNYAFDPRTHLIRYFEDNSYKPILLIDEAHNLINRSREMYSSEITKSTINKLPKLLKGIKPSIRKDVNEIIDHFNTYDPILEKVDYFIYQELDGKMVELMRKLNRKLELLLSDNKTNAEFITRSEVINIYFDIHRFIKISEFYNDNFIYIVEKDQFDYQISIRCLDASEYILDVVKNKAFGTIFFSATMYPLPYYQKLLTKEEGCYLKLESPFKREQLKFIIMDEYSTRYNERKYSITNIIETIDSLVSGKEGNYIVFFPSYTYLMQVVNEIKEAKYEMLIQKADLSDSERNAFLEQFKTVNKTKVGFFVMGGVFSEGIDYIGDMLSGVLIISTCLPMVNHYNNYLQSFFDKKFNAGFDYAYTYPGFNKVIQAVGRVIRSEKDRGVVILLDDRFTTQKYLKLMLEEWQHYQVINEQEDLKKEISLFWEQELYS